MGVRLQKIISQWGIASRRQAEEMIKLERVRVNGVLAHLGQKVNPETDTITVDGKNISAKKRPISTYLLINKPPGVVSTCYDPQARATVLDLLPKDLRSGKGIHPVGRLDADSTGALILTNDGDLTFKLTHPRHNIKKTYRVLVKGHPPEETLQMWREGVFLDNRKTRTASLQLIEKIAGNSCLEIVLMEGRNRQIRRIAEQLGYPVIQLHRTAIGSIKLQRPGEKYLSEGTYRHLTNKEITYLNKQLQEIPINDSAGSRSKEKDEVV
ncbi:pseudouridine synthase family protein [Rivularia sp. PCC 7116]|uniref:pseudouridine synthase n=1 Tax=Rivularia sp. PCC 7116 TaxID=373994 RepID=UPI00029ED1CA|nr:pseudouridine synthase [Rivularia sp. PCC 7116]AFY53382.1 pseudouridine synthase family protein [Rivularia sp. PCC 7116]